MTPADQIAQEVLDLINRHPRTPTKAQLTDCISVMLDVVKDDETSEAIVVPLGTVVQPQRPGAFIALQGDMSLLIDGWTISSSRTLTTHEAALAILEWMKKGVLLAPRQ